MRQTLFALLLVACGGTTTAPAPVDFTPLEGQWRLTPERDSAYVLSLSGIAHQGPEFAVSDAAVFWGSWQYVGSAQLSANTLTLYVVRNGPTQTINQAYTYTVNGTTLTLTANGTADIYTRVP